MIDVKVVGGRIPPKEHRKLRTEDAVSDILERMIFAKVGREKGVRKDCLFLPHEMGPMWARSPEGSDEDMIFWRGEEVNHPELVWPVGFGCVFHKRNDEWGDHLQCLYAQSTDAKQMRGKYRYVGKYNLSLYEGYLQRDGNWTSAVERAAWHWNTWRDAGYIRYADAFLTNVRPEGGAPVTAGYGRVDGEMTIGEQAALIQSMALTYRYEWGAQFAIDDSAKIIVPVTPEGALELFNDRDKPSDRDRRAALRHWVSQHLRTKAGGDFTKVREHLRGATSFNWRGFDVVLRPSQFDAERNGDGT